MPVIDEKNETEDDEMDQDSPDFDKSDDDESDSGSSDDGDSSEIDEAEIERRRNECLDDMNALEEQFFELKEHLCKERLGQVEAKLSEVRAEKALEYLEPLAELQENMRIHTQVAGILKELRIQNVKNQSEAESQAAMQNFESEKMLLFDHVRQELEDKIRRLEEDRHNIDISTEFLQSSNKRRKKGSGPLPHFTTPGDRRRKPVTVTDILFVYLVKHPDIVEDWTTIKKALKQSEKKKKAIHPKQEKHPFAARFEDGKLFYENEWYSRGHHIIIDNKEDSPVHASITAINTGEVWVKRSDGNKSKLYIAQLQKGKYTVRHVPY
ncbi:hypothetical protein CAPTEDRAFT_94286 [Capitella teleta]|uniref:Breast cancer metastasis-suppressor 1-like protein n=1 Tax=Capitella teleta TaxID=283909 RepID=R7U4R5_CAPTE|nr:hypothetical protein CAPTEDRAFT_94286 [Capitella teleta]|eukprot:ELU01106.1 hypothetical protein CAPTEDRAFT_94286 [Capitella teleta]